MLGSRLADGVDIEELDGSYYVPLIGELEEKYPRSESIKPLEPVKSPEVIIAIKENKKEKFDGIINTDDFKASASKKNIYVVSTQIKFNNAEGLLEKLEQQADEAINLFREFHWDPGFVLSLITFLGSTAGALALSIIENRWDGPFFAAACAGAAMVIMGGLSAMGCAVGFFSTDRSALAFAILVFGMWGLQDAVTPYYRRAIEPATPIDPSNPAGYAEGAGVLGLLAVLSTLSTCLFYEYSFRRIRPFSESEENKIYLAQDVLFPAKKKNIKDQKDHKSRPVVLTGSNPSDYFRAEVPDMLKEAKNQISNELQRLRKVYSFFPPDNVLPQSLKKLILDYYQPRWRPKLSRG